MYETRARKTHTRTHRQTKAWCECCCFTYLLERQMQANMQRVASYFGISQRRTDILNLMRHCTTHFKTIHDRMCLATNCQSEMSEQAQKQGLTSKSTVAMSLPLLGYVRLRQATSSVLRTTRPLLPDKSHREKSASTAFQPHMLP